MQPEPAIGAIAALQAVTAPVEDVLSAFLASRRAELAAIDPAATLLVDEVQRLVDAGGKRIRPALCVWGYRAGGAADDRVVPVAAALELFHTFALIHDDVMDRDELRRGVPTTAARHGDAVAILVGDLAIGLADDLFLSADFPAERLLRAFERYGQVRTEVAAGQLLDVSSGPGLPPAARRRIAALKTGAYTVEGPLHVGAILAGASEEVLLALAAFARPLGEAFQLRDDLLDAPHVASATASDVNHLLDDASRTLEAAPIPTEPATALRAIAGALRMAEV